MMTEARLIVNCPECGMKNDYDVVANIENVCECRSCAVIYEVVIATRTIPDAAHYRDEVWLHHEYWERDRTMADIASDFAVSPMTICHWLKRHAIPTRSRGRRLNV